MLATPPSNPEMTRRLAEAVDRAARRVGAPLHAVDILTSDRGLAIRFLAAEARGAGRDFFESLDHGALEAAIDARRRRAGTGLPVPRIGL